MLKTMATALAAASFLALGACTQETRVEEDTSAERAIEEAGDELEQAADAAGDELEEAGQQVEEAAEDATDGNPNTNP